MLTAVPQLFRPQVSGRLDYPDWVVTVQLEHFVESVRFVMIFSI